MAPVLSRELVGLLSSPHTTLSQAADAIEEHIIHRRSKGDSLNDVSASLSLIEGKSPRLVPAIRQAQYVTNVPQASGSNDGMPQATSSTPTSILAYLLADPMPPVHLSRKVMLEYVLSREARLREKKHGRGGKGTLGREGFEELASRMGEIEDGLRGTGPLAHASRMSRHDGQVADEDLSPARQTGLALVLSLRMLLSYFTLPDLAKQLLQQTPQDAERTLVQHVRRRVAGEGRYSVGRDLEYVESLTLNRRPALRPAFRSARNRTQLAPRALYPITLPAPSKSACIKMLVAFVKEVELAGPTAASSYMQTGPSGPMFPSGTDRSLRPRKASPKSVSPSSFGSSPSSPTPGSPSKGGMNGIPTDPSPMENYTIELLSEFLVREKREYMLKNKWVKTGREQLSKDLGDIELALCTSGKALSSNAPALLPAFLLLRRTFALPSSPLPARVTDQYFEMLPSPPDPDSVPLREPTVSSTTAMLYVNPRLPDDVALDAIEELIENEREKGLNAAISQQKTIAWLNGLVDQVEKRFPDGSYGAVLDRARFIAAHPRVWPDVSLSTSFPPPPPDEQSGHRRTKSSAHLSSHGHDDELTLPRERMDSMHSRSASMPMRSSMHSSGYSDSAASSPVRHVPASPNSALSPYSPTSALGPSSLPYAGGGDEHLASDDSSHYSRESANNTGGSESSKPTHDFSALGLGSLTRSNAPPMLSLFVPGPEIDLGLSMNTPSPSRMRFSSNSNEPRSAGSTGGWWDVISAGDEASPAHRRAPWANASNARSSGESQDVDLTSPLATVPPTNASPQVDATPKLNDGTPTGTPPKPQFDSPATPQLGHDSQSRGSTPKTTPSRKPVPTLQTEGATPPRLESMPEPRFTGYEESDFQPSYRNGVKAAYGAESSNHVDSPGDGSPPSSHTLDPMYEDDYTPSFNNFKPSYNTDFHPAPLQRDPVLSMDSLRASLPHRAAAVSHSRQPSQPSLPSLAHSRQASQSQPSQTHSRQPSQTHSRQPSQTHSRQPSRSKAGAHELPRSTTSFESSRSNDVSEVSHKDLPPMPPMPSMPEPRLPAKSPTATTAPEVAVPPAEPVPAPPQPVPAPPQPEPEPEAEPAELAAQSAARAEALSRLTGPTKAREPSPPPPPPEPELTEEQEDLYASLDFMPTEYKSTMSKKPAGAFSHAQQSQQQQSGAGLTRTASSAQQGSGLARSLSKPQQAQPGVSHTRSLSKTSAMGFGGAKAAPLVTAGDTSRWQRRRPSEHQALPIDTSPQGRIDEFGMGPKSAPGIPVSSSTWPKSIDDGSSQSADGHTGSGSGSLSRPGGFTTISPTESKGKFNLSSMMRGPKRDKENTAAAAAAMQQQYRARPPVSNNPGRWNRNMVADIMGPPASRGS